MTEKLEVGYLLAKIVQVELACDSWSALSSVRVAARLSMRKYALHGRYWLVRGDSVRARYFFDLAVWYSETSQRDHALYDQL